MCTHASHTVLQGGNCLCGAFINGQFCQARTINPDALPTLFKPKGWRPISNEECCGDPGNCERRQ